MEQRAGLPGLDDTHPGVDVDVVVLGTGAAGLTAAITAHESGASVAIYEKADEVGGTSAWSGGQIWIPNNGSMKALGKHDSADEAVEYLMSMSHGLIDEKMARAYVTTGPDMVTFIEKHSPVRFRCVADFPDYHPEQPGGKPGGGRTLECPPYSFHELGEWAERVTVSPYWPDIRVTAGETTICAPSPQPLPEEERERRVAGDERGLGQSLIGRLLRGCLDRGLQPRLGYRGLELETDGDGICAVRVEGPDGVVERVRTRNVVLATGGFDHSPDFVRAFLRGPLQTTVAVPTNTGDGLRMAMRLGAMLGTMREAWWMPLIEVPEQVVSAGNMLFMVERTLPGSIMVNASGRRFANEAANYNAFGAAFHEQDPMTSGYPNLPCWVVFDQQFYTKYGFVEPPVPDSTAPDWILRGNTLAELAARLGLPQGELEKTVDRWNGHVANGADPDFKRGLSWFDRWWGDPTCKGTPQATLGTIGSGPFYAVEVKSGSIGTKGGPLTDIDGQVLDLDLALIRGLFAAGNAMASPMGMTYGGGGGTLGPGMVFGYRAGVASAQRSIALAAR